MTIRYTVTVFIPLLQQRPLVKAIGGQRCEMECGLEANGAHSIGQEMWTEKSTIGRKQQPNRNYQGISNDCG